MNYIITGMNYNTCFTDILKKQSDVCLMTQDELAESDLYITEKDQVYVPSETALDIVLQRWQNSEMVEKTNMLKDKFLCREMMKSIYPSFHYQLVPMHELDTLELDRTKQYVIKPRKGFFGTAVRFIDATTDLCSLRREMEAELQDKLSLFSDSVLSTDMLILEEMITGDEYAVDMFYNEQGQPVIMNIYHHPESRYSEYFHLLYYTDRALFKQFYTPLYDFFVRLNDQFAAKNFPIHAEFKLQAGQLVPIELNPLRYGGFGLADLAGFAFDFQPILAYFYHQVPDWDKIWSTREENHYGWILAYNGKSVDTAKATPLHDKFKERIGDYLHYVEMDSTKYPVFAIAYVAKKSKAELLDLLEIDFDDYFETRII